MDFDEIVLKCLLFLALTLAITLQIIFALAVIERNDCTAETKGYMCVQQEKGANNAKKP